MFNISFFIFHFFFFLNISPGIVECLLAGVPDNGYGGCTKGSRAASGNIVVTFTAADQVAVVALVPNQKLFSKIKITCSELDACTLFTVSLEFNHLWMMRMRVIEWKIDVNIYSENRSNANDGGFANNCN